MLLTRKWDFGLTIMPVKCCEIKMFLTSILRDEVDHMLLTISWYGDIVQGFYLHVVCQCLCMCRRQKLLSMLNYAFSFHLCWNYDYGLSLHWNFFFGFFLSAGQMIIALFLQLLCGFVLLIWLLARPAIRSWVFEDERLIHTNLWRPYRT